MENLKIKIQILDEQNSVLISSTINKSTIDSVAELHNRSVLTDVYNSMLEDLSINKILCEPPNSTLDKVESTMDSIKEWEVELIGKNQHSVLTKCFDCGSMGVNMPEVTECGNCGGKSTVRYYDSETLDGYLKASEWKR